MYQLNLKNHENEYKINTDNINISGKNTLLLIISTQVFLFFKPYLLLNTKKIFSPFKIDKAYKMSALLSRLLITPQTG